MVDLFSWSDEEEAVRGEREEFSIMDRAWIKMTRSDDYFRWQKAHSISHCASDQSESRNVDERKRAEVREGVSNSPRTSQNTCDTNEFNSVKSI